MTTLQDNKIITLDYNFANLEDKYFMKNNCLKRHFGLIYYNLLNRNISRFNADNLQNTIS